MRDRRKSETWPPPGLSEPAQQHSGRAMLKALFLIGGILNVAFCVFHILLGLQIRNLPNLDPGYRGLMEALNIGGALFICFIAYASLIEPKELEGTRVGNGVLAVTAVLYLSRAVEEFILFRGNVAIFGACLVTGLIYAVLLVLSLRKRAATPVNRAAAA